MVGSIFLVLFILKGSFAQVNFGVCDVDECSRKYRQELGAVFTNSDPPTVEAITKSCPGLMKLTNCVEGSLLQCTGEKLEVLKSSENTSISMAASITLSIRMVLHDICNETRDLLKSYIQHVDCATKFVRRRDTTCWKDGKRLWAEYLGNQNLNSSDTNLRKERDCIEAAYGTSCFAVQIGTECGRKAKDLFIDIGFKGLDIFKTFFCRPSEYSHLRLGFLNSLEGNVEIKNALQRAFEGSDFVGSVSHDTSNSYHDTSNSYHETSNSYLLMVILFSSLLLN